MSHPMLPGGVEAGSPSAASQSPPNASALPPMCAWCRRVRNSAGHWITVEGDKGGWRSHGICPDCSRDLTAALSLADQAISETSEDFPTK